jgi:hypothetical protein
MSRDQLVRVRDWLNEAYLDKMTLGGAEYQSVFGCKCTHGGAPKRIVLDGNSLGYRDSYKAISKPWADVVGNEGV